MRYLLFFMWFFDFFYLSFFYNLSFFFSFFFLSQNFSTEKNVMSEWKWSIYSDSHHTPHTVYAIEFLIGIMIDCIWLETFNSVNEQSRYLLFFIRSVFYFFIFLRNFYHQSKWKWGIYSDSHHTPHTVYAIDFLIRLSMNDDWLELIDSVNEQSRYLLFFMWFFWFFLFVFFFNLSFYLSFFSKSKFFNWKKWYEWMKMKHLSW